MRNLGEKVFILTGFNYQESEINCRVINKSKIVGGIIYLMGDSGTVKNKISKKKHSIVYHVRYSENIVDCRNDIFTEEQLFESIIKVKQFIDGHASALLAELISKVYNDTAMEEKTDVTIKLKKKKRVVSSRKKHPKA